MEKQFEHEWQTQLDDGSTIFRTCAWSPPGCHPTSCGVEITVKDGKIVHVEGDESQPITNGRLCPRCLALKDYTYHEDRIVHPMKRAKEFRGQSDKWERTTWEEAYDIIEEQVGIIKEKYGAESIAVYGGTGREASMFYWPIAYSVLGTPNVVYPLSGVSCYGPRQMTAAFILGAGYPEIDYAAYFPERFDNPEFELPKYVVCWGKMPLYSNGDGLFGHALIDMMKMGTRFICIDPRITWLGAQPGNLTVQLRPGTDTALALALINTIVEEGLYDLVLWLRRAFRSRCRVSSRARCGYLRSGRRAHPHRGTPDLHQPPGFNRLGPRGRPEPQRHHGRPGDPLHRGNHRKHRRARGPHLRRTLYQYGRLVRQLDDVPAAGACREEAGQQDLPGVPRSQRHLPVRRNPGHARKRQALRAAHGVDQLDELPVTVLFGTARALVQRIEGHGLHGRAGHVHEPDHPGSGRHLPALAYVRRA